MQELAVSAIDGFLRDGAALLFFSAPWSPPAVKLEPLLESLGDELQGTLRIGRVDIERHPEAVVRFSLTACPTCEFFINGEPRARVVGAASRTLLMDSARSLGIAVGAPSVSPAPWSPILTKALAKAELIDELEEGVSIAAITEQLAAGATAFERMGQSQAEVLSKAFAPAYFTCARELPILVRYMVRELKANAGSPATRFGLLSALTYFAIDEEPVPDVPLRGGYAVLDDWLVLQTARLEFLDPPENLVEFRSVSTLEAFVANALPRRALEQVASIVASISAQAEALRNSPPGAVELLLEDQLVSEVPREYLPPVLPPLRKPSLVASMQRRAVGGGFEGTSAYLRFDDHTSVLVSGAGVHVRI